MKAIRIGERLVGEGYPCLVIAEAGVNHNGDIGMAYDLVKQAAKAGADAVKFQSFVTEEIVSRDAAKADYQVETTGSGGSQYDMLKALELAPEQQAKLCACCEEEGLLYLCTPYDQKSVDVLHELDVAAFKIASTDTTNIPFIEYVARKERPVILSTGMCSLGEVEQAMECLEGAGLEGQTVLLHCVAEYPAPVEQVNLRVMNTLARAFCCPVGFSDHTAGIGVAPWAVVAGALVIEKHFTLDRSLPGPDHRASLEPHEFRDMVKDIRQVEAALGDGIKRVMPDEAPNKPRLQKSLVSRRRIAAGEIVQVNDLTCKRPGTGLPPAWHDRVIGRRVAVTIEADSVLTLGCVDWREAPTSE